MVVDAHTEFALQERCSGGMIVVPVCEKNCFQPVLREVYFSKPFEKVGCFGVHAYIDRENSAGALNNIRAREVGGSTKAPHAIGDRNDLHVNVRPS